MGNLITLYAKCKRCGAFVDTEHALRIEACKGGVEDDESVTRFCLCEECAKAFNRFFCVRDNVAAVNKGTRNDA